MPITTAPVPNGKLKPLDAFNVLSAKISGLEQDINQHIDTVETQLSNLELELDYAIFLLKEIETKNDPAILERHPKLDGVKVEIKDLKEKVCFYRNNVQKLTAVSEKCNLLAQTMLLSIVPNEAEARLKSLLQSLTDTFTVLKARFFSSKLRISAINLISSRIHCTIATLKEIANNLKSEASTTSKKDVKSFDETSKLASNLVTTRKTARKTVGLNSLSTKEAEEEQENLVQQLAMIMGTEPKRPVLVTIIPKNTPWQNSKPAAPFLPSNSRLNRLQPSKVSVKFPNIRPFKMG